MLSAGLPITVASVDAPGSFDTHDDQREDFERGLKTTCDGLLAFQRDLEARGLDDRVLTLVWSEFGRRPEENDSDGTDHGAGGQRLPDRLGTRAGQDGRRVARPRQQLDEDENLRSTFDFRSLYCGLLEQWFGVDAAAVIPGAGSFPRAALIG